MGFIKAFTGALGGTFADEWKDFYVPRGNVPATAAIFGAEKKGTDEVEEKIPKDQKILLQMEENSSTRGNCPNYITRWCNYWMYYRTRWIYFSK